MLFPPAGINSFMRNSVGGSTWAGGTPVNSIARLSGPPRPPGAPPSPYLRGGGGVNGGAQPAGPPPSPYAGGGGGGGFTASMGSHFNQKWDPDANGVGQGGWVPVTIDATPGDAPSPNANPNMGMLDTSFFAGSGGLGSSYEQREANAKPGALGPPHPLLAYGGSGVKTAIVGDPQADGLPNPELVSIQNGKLRVMPLKGDPPPSPYLNGAVPKLAYGTQPDDVPLSSYPTVKLDSGDSLSSFGDNRWVYDANGKQVGKGSGFPAAGPPPPTTLAAGFSGTLPAGAPPPPVLGQSRPVPSSGPPPTSLRATPSAPLIDPEVERMRQEMRAHWGETVPDNDSENAETVDEPPPSGAPPAAAPSSGGPPSPMASAEAYETWDQNNIGYDVNGFSGGGSNAGVQLNMAVPYGAQGAGPPSPVLGQPMPQQPSGPPSFVAGGAPPPASLPFVPGPGSVLGTGGSSFKPTPPRALDTASKFRGAAFSNMRNPPQPGAAVNPNLPPPAPRLEPIPDPWMPGAKTNPIADRMNQGRNPQRENTAIQRFNRHHPLVGPQMDLQREAKRQELNREADKFNQESLQKQAETLRKTAHNVAQEQHWDDSIKGRDAVETAKFQEAARKEHEKKVSEAQDFSGSLGHVQTRIGMLNKSDPRHDEKAAMLQHILNNQKTAQGVTAGLKYYDETFKSEPEARTINGHPGVMDARGGWHWNPNPPAASTHGKPAKSYYE